jgi:hypothetical protein
VSAHRPRHLFPATNSTSDPAHPPSDTVHELPELKDGASWAALEYAKNLRDPATSRILSNGKPLAREPQDVVICIAGISYSDKTKYRACAVMQCV